MQTAKNRYLIDPGHGGSDPGAVNEDLREKGVVLDVSSRLAKLLAADRRFDGKVSMSRNDDRFVGLSERADMANRLGAILLSIHANAGGGSGYEAFVANASSQASKDLARYLLVSYGAEFSDWRLRAGNGTPWKTATFTVLTRTRGPAVLFELGFVDHEMDRARLASAEYRQRMALALYMGILAFEGMPYLSEDPMPLGAIEEAIARLDPPSPPPLGRIAASDEFLACAEWLETSARSLGGTVIGADTFERDLGDARSALSFIEAAKALRYEARRLREEKF